MALPHSAPATFEVRVVPDAENLAREAASEFSAAAVESVRDRGSFRVALAGGSTPRAVHERLTRSPFRDRVEWSRVLFFFGDERCVPPAHERSNYRMARETLLGPLAIAPAQVFRIRGEAEPRQAAADYERILEREFAEDRGWPRMDFVFLGLGEDGHTASLFPGTRALEEKGKRVCPNYVAKLREWRVTLTYPVFNAARRVVFLAVGKEKSGPASKILKKQRSYRQLPASAIRPRAGALLWLLDEAAGSDL